MASRTAIGTSGPTAGQDLKKWLQIILNDHHRREQLCAKLDLGDSSGPGQAINKSSEVFVQCLANWWGVAANPDESALRVAKEALAVGDVNSWFPDDTRRKQLQGIIDRLSATGTPVAPGGESPTAGTAASSADRLSATGTPVTPGGESPTAGTAAPSRRVPEPAVITLVALVALLAVGVTLLHVRTAHIVETGQSNTQHQLQEYQRSMTASLESLSDRIGLLQPSGNGGLTVVVASGSVFQWMNRIGWHTGSPGAHRLTDEGQKDLGEAAVILDVGTLDALSVVSRAYRHGIEDTAWARTPLLAMGVGPPKLRIDKPGRHFIWVPLFNTDLVVDVHESFPSRLQAMLCKERFPRSSPEDQEKCSECRKWSKEAKWSTNELSVSILYELLTNCFDKNSSVDKVLVPSSTSGTLRVLNSTIREIGGTKEDIVPGGAWDPLTGSSSAVANPGPPFVAWTLEHKTAKDQLKELYSKVVMAIGNNVSEPDPTGRFKRYRLTVEAGNQTKTVPVMGWALVPILHDTAGGNYRSISIPTPVGNVLSSMKNTRGEAPITCWHKDLSLRREPSEDSGAFTIALYDDKSVNAGVVDECFGIPSSCEKEAESANASHQLVGMIEGSKCLR